MNNDYCRHGLQTPCQNCFNDAHHYNIAMQSNWKDILAAQQNAKQPGVGIGYQCSATCGCANQDCIQNGCLNIRRQNGMLPGGVTQISTLIGKISKDKPPLIEFESKETMGWECPKCSKVFAPHIEECRGCNG